MDETNAGPTTVRRSSVLAIDAATAWGLLQQPQTFLFVVRGLLGMPALRARRSALVAGESGSGWLLLVHAIPLYRHTLHVVSVDHDTLTIHTHERGGVLRMWNHTLALTPIDAMSCRYDDTIEIDAGRLTPLAVSSARLLFRYRHRRWRRLAALYPPR